MQEFIEIETAEKLRCSAKTVSLQLELHQLIPPPPLDFLLNAPVP